MRSFRSLPYLVLLLLISCQSGEESKPISSENDIDAARNFIRAALDGKWTDARRFILQDSLNSQFLDTYERNYQTHMTREDKRGYREATIKLYTTEQLNDTVSIVHYSNSYINQKNALKVIRRAGQWLVDLKYSFTQTDSTKQ
ncbi:MAG TPA: hypothetical protein VHK91_13985 [Flavisolibacter sp.]|jgi:vacuolar-type H+-ATPase catalytic subunit A/Vma1|nr:hypothetical protein [Flavisolibacter sp.]